MKAESREEGKRNIYLLGLVSLLNDASSEIIQPILPLFIASLGAGGVAVGLIGGLSDGLPSLLKVVSGCWSDRMGRRKPLVAAGYGISAAGKLFLAIAASWQQVLVLKTLERSGKGVRSAPRDAIIAESASREGRGRGFGIHRALDSLGAVIGSVLAYLLWQGGMDFRTIFVVAGIVAFVALLPLIPVREKSRSPVCTIRPDLSEISPDLRQFIAISSLFALANFSYMFFILRATDFFSGGMAVGAPLLLYVLFNLVYTIFSIPSGSWSDRVGRKKVLTLGYSLFALVSLGFALVSSTPVLVLLFSLYGLVFAIVDGAERAFVSDLCRAEIRGTGFGVYYGAVGVSAIVSGVGAGFLWQYLNPQATFLFGASAAFMAAILLIRMENPSAIS
ncbi:MAG: MFS transporter [Methanothrix sp.]|jgi:MFS family permease|uniref:Transporter, major facilitator family n=1 Tax=Methanothrix harundinacea TaxID=301375 RepID=A0A101IKB1_9EURY|nr:MAG: Transporter, major facilitator family [Methanothrix harundinacea]KUK96797.1 MAG: Transporter, major facilitator family [Methanothrix harundinacea]MCP1392399.1 MFS transporter [Methanothrix harundinacea]MDD3710196.1 MFS transporter [Methanothrix sp.]MDI9398144.1 MFS transporter [Euryarchaeota archaeon]